MNSLPRLLIVVFVVVMAVSPARGDQVRFSISDAETGTQVAARAYLQCSGKAVFPPGTSIYRRGLEEHFLLSGDDRLELPSGPCTVTVARGLEYEPVEISFTSSPDSTVSVRLKRWASMNRSGWYSADMHVHRDPKDMARILLAEDLNFAPTITYHVWSDSASQRFPNATGFPVVVDANHLFTANAEEVERIQGGPGAVILLAPELPIPFDGHEFYPPAVHYTRQAHRQGGYVGGDKLFWLDTYVNVALEEIDFIEINCNHFLPHDVDTDLPPWSHWPVEMGYVGDHDFALWMMDFYYGIVNCGFHLPLSGGSASGVKATPVGYDRVYAYLGELPFTYENFMKALEEGRTFSTNGPLLDLKINRALGPGSRSKIKSGEEVRVDALVRSLKGLAQVDLIVNGKVWRTYQGNGRKELRLNEKLAPEKSSWVALRAFEPAEQTVVFGHTSPAYVFVDDQPIRSPADARMIIEKVDQLISYTETKGRFRSEQEKLETLTLYRQARRVYEDRQKAP